MPKRKLIALDGSGGHLFIRFVQNKAEGRREIMRNPFLYRIAKVQYNKKEYTISEIYRVWPIVV